MKKFLKVLAATAAIASVIPLRNKVTETGGSLEALLWKADWTHDPDYQSEPDVHISIGFNNIFRKPNEEAELFADELVVDYCCDTTLVRDCTCDEEYDDVDASTDECACNETCESAE